MLPISPKTADYIPYGGLIATLLGTNSHRERFYSAKLWKFSEENMNLLSDIFLKSRHTLFLIS